MKEIARGAEAVIFQDSNRIIKKRIEKGYRIKELDIPLRRFRTKRESKIIEKLNSLKIAPKLIKNDEYNIEMEQINGIQIKKILDNNPKLAQEIGKTTALIHNHNIIHGDLTTSNMILNKNKIFFIDFGLSFFSDKTEDKAVDIHLFKQALESKHYKVWEKAYKYFLKGYKPKHYKEILERLNIVESRGRNKEKY